MPESRTPSRRWRALGRLLPRDVRERVFEPALADLTYRWLTDTSNRRRLPFGLRAVGTYAGCIPIAVPRLFVKQGRLTRLGRFTVWSTAVFAVLLLVGLNLVRSYATYG